ncbi:hypothetical protein ABT160_23610 [Streptomyces sp. NPDC001941]|uniref:hypothetical protein n=1 Tax=Streptomyces sp. NPDC001941 TaxID=3154659 RepID=UPI003324A4E1
MWYGKTRTGRVEHFGASLADDNAIEAGNALCGKHLPVSDRTDVLGVVKVGKPVRVPSCKACAVKFRDGKYAEVLADFVQKEADMATAKKATAAKKPTAAPKSTAAKKTTASKSAAADPAKALEQVRTFVEGMEADGYKGDADADAKTAEALIRKIETKERAGFRTRVKAAVAAAKERRSTAVVSKETTDLSGLENADKLIKEVGAKVKATGDGFVKATATAYEVAQAQIFVAMQMTDKNGRMDWNLASGGSKEFSNRAYAAGGYSLEGVEEGTPEHTRAYAVQQQVKRARSQARVDIIRALDATEESELHPQVKEAIAAYPELRPSAAVFKHFDLPSESEGEKKALAQRTARALSKAKDATNKALESAKAASSSDSARSQRAKEVVDSAVQVADALPIDFYDDIEGDDLKKVLAEIAKLEKWISDVKAKLQA